jgi:hypothetical protein
MPPAIAKDHKSAGNQLAVPGPSNPKEVGKGERKKTATTRLPLSEYVDLQMLQRTPRYMLMIQRCEARGRRNILAE